MSNTQENIINQITQQMGNTLNTNQLYQLQNVLSLVLHEYTIENRKNEIEVFDDSNINLMQRFLISKQLEGMSERSIERYKLVIVMFIDSINKRLCDINTNDIRYYLITYKNTRKVSSTTLDGIRRVLNSFFQWLNDEDYIDKNPVKRIVPFKKDTFKKPAFTQTELELINLACKNLRDKAILEFMKSTGCRVSEIASVNISDVDFINMQLDVIGKGNKKRTVYLTDASVLHIKRYLQSRNDNNPALFVTLRGCNRMKKCSIEQLCRKLGTASGVSNCHPHRFRTTLCCNLLDRGVDVTHVQQILGHSSINTTMIYYRYNQERTKAAFKMAVA